MRGNYRHGLAALLSCGLVTACGDIGHHNSLLPKITLTKEGAERALQVCAGTIDEVERLPANISEKIRAYGSEANQVLDEDKKSLRNTKVVQNNLRIIAARKAEMIRAIKLHTGKLDADTDRYLRSIIEEGNVQPLQFQDLKDFYNAVLKTKSGQGFKRVVEYESAYFNGNFVDRFGNKLEKPAIKATVTNDQVAQIITVLLEATADEIFTKTPVWTDKKKAAIAAIKKANRKDAPTDAAPSTEKAAAAGAVKFYPGNTTNIPTFLAVRSAAWDENGDIDMVQELDATPACGMTKLKAEALIYLTGKASYWAAGMSGFALGAIGGVNVGLPVFMGKVSIGDNQIAQEVTKAVFAFLATRITYEMALPLLMHIDESAIGVKTVGGLVEHFHLLSTDDANKADAKEASNKKGQSSTSK